jgi:hypothetical protein
MAIEAYKREQSDKTALGWALFALAHPIFADACGLIGKVTAVQNTFTASWLKERICEIHGERPTLLRAVGGVLETMKCLDGIHQEKAGVYHVKKRTVKDEQTMSVLLMSLFALGKKAYYEIPELSRVSIFFPFEYDITLEWLHRNPEFSIGHFGGKMTVSAE